MSYVIREEIYPFCAKNFSPKCKNASKLFRSDKDDVNGFGKDALGSVAAVWDLF